MTPLLRDAARAILLDPDDRLLLVRFEFPDRGLWATPGGGVDPGESHEQALLRELDEETGFAPAAIGPCVWLRTHVFDPKFGTYDGQRERYFLLRTPAFEPAPRLTRQQLEAEYVFGIRWWTQAELAASDDLFAPTRLPELVAALIADGPPPAPVAIGA